MNAWTKKIFIFFLITASYSVFAQEKKCDLQGLLPSPSTENGHPLNFPSGLSVTGSKESSFPEIDFTFSYKVESSSPLPLSQAAMKWVSFDGLDVIVPVQKSKIELSTTNQSLKSCISQIPYTNPLPSATDYYPCVKAYMKTLTTELSEDDKDFLFHFLTANFGAPHTVKAQILEAWEIINATENTYEIDRQRAKIKRLSAVLSNMPAWPEYTSLNLYRPLHDVTSNGKLAFNVIPSMIDIVNTKTDETLSNVYFEVSKYLIVSCR